MKIRFLICALFTFFVGFSQHVDTKVITVNEGLFSNNIQKVLVDSEGTLWIGSRAGLSKRNMNSFEIVKEATQFKFNNIFDIYEDDKKQMWIGGYGQGVLFFNKKSSKLINTSNGLVNNFVRKIFPFKDKIYVGTLNGISVISKSDFGISNPKFIQNPNYEFTVTSFFISQDKIYATTLNDGVYLIDNDRVVKVSDIKKIFSSYVWNGAVYLGTEKELVLLNSTNFKIVKKYPVPNIWEFYLYENKIRFISSGVFDNDGGIYMLDNGVLKSRVKPLKIPFLDLKSFSYDCKNELLYIGTQNNGLIKVNLNAPVYHQEALKNVFTLVSDSTNNYVFHDKGFSIFKNDQLIKHVGLSEFKKTQLKKYLKHKNHTVITNHFYPIDYETSADKMLFYNSLIFDNKLWVSSNIGLFELNLAGEIINYHPIHIFHFTFFDQKLLTVVPYAGIRIFDNIDKMEYDYHHNWNNPNIPVDIVSIAKSKNAVYFASALSGLYEFRDGKFKSFVVSDEFKEAKLKRITIAANGNLFVVTDFNDVYELKIANSSVQIVKHISYKNIKGSSTAFIDEIGDVLYIGTNLGINVFYKSKYFFIDKSQGLNNYSFKQAFENNSNLYISTTNGFFVINNCYFKNESQNVSKAKISNILINNKALSQDSIDKFSEGLTLDYTENNLNILFSVANEKYSDKLKFKYRLKSSEPWSDLTSENQINLSYLDYGLYNLEVQIVNEDSGNVIIQPLLKIEILPPFYVRLPFILILIGIIILIAFVIFRIRIKIIQNVQEQKLKLLAIKTEKEKKELLFDKQLAEVKLQALKSQMNSHFLFNVLSSIQYFIISRDVDNALYYLERFSNLIRRTLDFSDKKKITLSEEIDYLKQYIEIENIRVENHIDFKVVVYDGITLSEVSIAPLLLQPFIENAIVHAFPETISNPVISLEVFRQNDLIKILIKDNGIGKQLFKEKHHDSKGINIVKKRLELTQRNFENKISINFTNQGTIVEILLDL